MDGERMSQNCDLFQEGGVWKLGWRKGAPDLNGFGEGSRHEQAVIGPVAGPEGLTENEAQRIASNIFLTQLQEQKVAQQSVMTVARFVEMKFVPEHVSTKRLSGRTHYQAILKHVLTPEEVDRVFKVVVQRPAQRLKAVPDWPYLSDVLLHDARPEHVERLISAAISKGYSAQTVTHIRNVVSAIFSHAKQQQCLKGDNPASQVHLPGVTWKETRALTPTQAKEVLREMQYPEKEMTLIAILTGMDVSEICGLQWKRVNLNEVWSNSDGELIPPRTIAVRELWYRGVLGSVKKSRIRNLPIPWSMLPILQRLGLRENFAGPNDFVLVSRAGTPINETNIVERRLKPLGRQMQMPSLSWHVFRRTHKALISEFGIRFQDQVGMLIHSAFRQGAGAQLEWRCRAPRERSLAR
jgi:integrase